MKSDTQIKLFIGKFLLLLILFLGVDFLAGLAFRYFYFKQKSGAEFQTIYSVERTDEDILFFGSSRASHHYVPDVFSNKFSLPAFNTGRDGNFLLYGYAVSKSVFSRYTPKLIILDISRKEFELKNGGYDYLSSLLPFYSSHPELRETLKKRSKFEPVKLLLKSYPYNSLLPVIGLNVIRDSSKIKYSNGYSPLHRIITRPPELVKEGNIYTIDSYLAETFRNWILLCKDKGVKIVVICSPYYDTFKQSDPTLNEVRSICAGENVLFLDYSSDLRFTGKADKFDDYHHLNDKAAIEFSEICADTISNFFESPN